MTDSLAVIDSLRRVIDQQQAQLAARPPDPLVILEKVHGFYSTAWGQLVVYVTLLFAVVGLVVPVVAQLIQRQLLKVDEDRLKRELVAHFDELAKSTEVKATQALETARLAMREDLEAEASAIRKNLAHATAGVHMVQANLLATMEQFVPSIVSESTALLSALESGSQKLVENCLNFLAAILKRVKPSDLAVDSEARTRLDRAMGAVSEANHDGRFTDLLAKVEAVYAPLRTSQP